MSEWEVTILGEVLRLQYGKDHKTLANGSIPCFGSGGIIRYVNQAIYDEESILIPRKGTLNNILYQDKPFWTVDTMFWSKINTRRVLPKFLYYQLQLVDFTNLDVGSAVPSLTIPVISDIDILLPPFPEQKAISEVLSSLDDKIDLLHRQNKTLEVMAETLFRQWFIEEVEEDWEEVSLKEIVELQSGFPFKSKAFRETGKYKVITIKAVQDGYLELSNADRIDKIPDKMPLHCFLNIGDILLSLTGNVGRCCIVDSQNLLLNQRVAKIKTPKSIYNAFVYAFFRRSETRLQLIEMAKGTAQLNLSPIETGNIKIKLPPIQTLNSFNDFANPVFNRLIANMLLIRNIVVLRDTLLPKLISGEVRVKLE